MDKLGVFLLAVLFSSVALSNPDKTRIEYNKCLRDLSKEQRKIDQVMNPARSRCDNTGVCVEITIGESVGQAVSRSDTFAKGQDCMYRLDKYELACKEANKDCVFTTFDEIYKEAK